jgi:dUTP pyrophosphatase
MKKEIMTKVSLEMGACLPSKGRSNDVGYDLTVYGIERTNRGLAETCTYLADFGVAVEPPFGYYFELIPRSSIAWLGFIMPNSVGVIDPDYRGTLKMPLIFMGDPKSADRAAENLVGKRVAQLILRPMVTSEFVTVAFDELSKTVRGNDGFGSSGQ